MQIRSRVTGTLKRDALGEDRDVVGTFEVNFAPRAASASVAISEIWGGYDCQLGIRSFEYRDSPSGPNKKKDFTLAAGSFYFPTSAYHRLMTRVTFSVAVAPDSYCVGGWTLDFWS